MVDISSDGGLLTIEKASQEHAGIYACNATNSAGSTQASASLTVVGEGILFWKIWIFLDLESFSEHHSFPEHVSHVIFFLNDFTQH